MTGYAYLELLGWVAGGGLSGAVFCYLALRAERKAAEKEEGLGEDD